MSLEWNEEQTRFLIDERKTGNEVYHKTPKRSKADFWEEISNKLNENNNTWNYFTGEACNKKFLSLTRAYYTAKAYKEGTKKKRSLVGEQYYNEFSSEFWKDPGARPPSVPNTPRRSQPSRIPRPVSHSQVSASANTARTASKILSRLTIPRPNVSHSTTPAVSRPVTPSTIETPPTSRPVTPTIPSFSQNANVINVTINYGGGPEED